MRAPLTVASVFYVGSAAKQFTAAGVALLTLDGALALDDPVARHAPALAGLGPITLRHLVHHTSGVRDYFDLLALRGWRRGDYLNNASLTLRAGGATGMGHEQSGTGLGGRGAGGGALWLRADA
jgi:CubicO group peptidase (beta-lactamase class C family)